MKRGLEERQLVRSKCDCRENKLEKTKGTARDDMHGVGSKMYCGL